MSKKVRNYKIQIINLKFRNESGSMTDYSKLFTKLFDNKIRIKIQGNRYAVIRTCFHDEIDGSSKILYGKFSKYTTLESGDWLDWKTFESTTFEIPKDKFPNLLETDYFFFPEFHRLAVVINKNVNIKTVATFIKEAINKIKDPNEIVEVVIEQSYDAFEKIIQAEILQRLEIHVSYSNSDNYEDAAEFVDNELKDSHSNSVTIIAKPDQNGNILIEKSKILMGLLELSQNNGNAKATIKNESKREIINTSKYPKSLTVKATDQDNLKYNLFDVLNKNYRKKNNAK